MGIAVDEDPPIKVLNATGWTRVHKAKIGLEIFHDGWIDLGTIDVVSPDTEVSRDPDKKLLFLLGRRGFFDKFHLLLDEPGKAAWLRKIA